MALGLLAGGALSSCTVNDTPSLKETGSMLAKAPHSVAYSGNHYWGTTGTRGFDVNGNMWSQNWDCVDNVYPDLTDEDLAEIKRLLSPGHEVSNEIIIPFENYWVQQVFKGDSEYNTHDRCTQPDCDHINSQTELGSSHMEHLKVNNGGSYEHVNDFNSGDNTRNHGYDNGCGITHAGTTLMTNMSTNGVTANNQFGYDETWGTSPKFFNNYYIIEYKGYYYVGFDYEAHKNDQTTHNHNEGMDIPRDWNFTDWIVRIAPAYPKGTTPENPGDNNTDDNNGGENHGGDSEVTDPCGNCGHSEANHNSEGVCEDCLTEGMSGADACVEKKNPGETGGDTTNPGGDVAKGYDEVEINLALDEKEDGDLLESHLSMHVRSATDVKVFIPVPAQYYCEADDMAIVLEHKEAFEHGGPYSMEYNIGGNIVTLNVAFEEEGIYIWTDGITQEVIDYCWENYQDGVTFEVWNYFNNPETGEALLSMEELKWFLNHSTVEFLDKIPGKYINSFGEGNGRYENDDPSTHGNSDFHVGPTSQLSEFDGPEQNAHLNGSDNNDIFTKK